MTHLLNNFYAVQIPEDANGFELYDNNVIGGLCIMYLRGNPDYACEYTPNLPPGSWSIISTSEEMTEEQAAGIVEPLFSKEVINEGGKYRAELDLNPMPFKNYLWDTDLDDGSQFSTEDTALESFQSLLKSKSLEGRQLILKLDDGGNKS